MTIKDLAALSGYSLGTVSRVLNNQPHVSEKAREQIMAIVKEQGFELNTNARNLKQTHSNNILVIVRGTHNELFATLVERLQTVATGGEYQLVVDYIGELDNEVRRAVKRVREVKPQGILLPRRQQRGFHRILCRDPHSRGSCHKLRRGIPIQKSFERHDRRYRRCRGGRRVSGGHGP